MADDLSPEGLAAIKAATQPCGSCDGGLPMKCGCLPEPRPVLAALVAEVERLRHVLEGHAAEGDRLVSLVLSMREKNARLRAELDARPMEYRRFGWVVTTEWHGPEGLERQQSIVRTLPDPPWAGQVEAVEVFVRDGDS